MNNTVGGGGIISIVSSDLVLADIGLVSLFSSRDPILGTPPGGFCHPFLISDCVLGFFARRGFWFGSC